MPPHLGLILENEWSFDETRRTLWIYSGVGMRELAPHSRRTARTWLRTRCSGFAALLVLCTSSATWVRSVAAQAAAGSTPAASSAAPSATTLANRVGFDKAITTLRKAVELGYRDFAFIQEDHDLDSIRKDPRFRKLLKEYQGQ